MERVSRTRLLSEGLEDYPIQRLPLPAAGVYTRRARNDELDRMLAARRRMISHATIHAHCR